MKELLATPTVAGPSSCKSSSEILFNLQAITGTEIQSERVHKEENNVQVQSHIDSD